MRTGVREGLRLFGAAGASPRAPPRAPPPGFQPPGGPPQRPGRGRARRRRETRGTGGRGGVRAGGRPPTETHRGRHALRRHGPGPRTPLLRGEGPSVAGFLSAVKGWARRTKASGLGQGRRWSANANGGMRVCFAGRGGLSSGTPVQSPAANPRGAMGRIELEGATGGTTTSRPRHSYKRRKGAGHRTGSGTAGSGASETARRSF